MCGLLENKNAVIYGGGGAIGGAVALAFAKEGARVFLAGRTLSSLDKVARQINRNGAMVETSQVNALDAGQVEKHLAKIVTKTGSIDISFNAIGLEDTHGFPLTQMSHEEFALPVFNAVTTHFFTATAAAKHMIKNGSGVILAITANAGCSPHPNVGGFGVACSAIEAFCRQMAVEVGQHGIRVVCLRSAGSPDAPGVDEVFSLHAKNAGISQEEFEKKFAERTMLKRLPRLAEVANAAVLMACGYASAITGAITNITCGEIAD
jgi:NAD(P)-dependent dehydrogenase (short-subunit alcohol dehydrogenase family)